MKIRLTAVFFFIVMASLPLSAKDKPYEDGLLVNVNHARPTMALIKQGAGGGSLVAKFWYLDVKVGGLTYGGIVEKGKVKDGDFEANAPVKVRIDKSSGMLGSKTTMYLLNSKEKDDEIELKVYSLKDKDGTEYCDNSKCNHAAAEKKAQ